MLSPSLAWSVGLPFQKRPPSPAYLGMYVGLLALNERPARRRWLVVRATFGRASLVASVTQYYLYLP